MSGGGSSGSKTQTTQTQLPDWYERELKSGAKLAERSRVAKLASPQEFFPGQTYADLDPRQTAGLEGAYGLAQGGGSPVLGAGLGQAADTLGGQYLQEQTPYDYEQGVGGAFDPNLGRGGPMNAGTWSDLAGGGLDYDTAMGDFSPDAFDEAVRAAARPEMQRISGQFAAAGRNGPAGVEASTDAIARAYAGLYSGERDRRAGLYNSERGRLAGLVGADRGQTAAGYAGERGLRGGMSNSERGRDAALYGGERNRMLGATGLTPGLDSAAYTPFDRMTGIGNVFQGQDQRGIDEARTRYDWGQNRDDNTINEYINRVQGTQPGGAGIVSQTTPTTSNPLLGALGGAGVGATLAGGLPAGLMTAVPGLGWGLPLLGGLAGLMGNR